MLDLVLDCGMLVMLSDHACNIYYLQIINNMLKLVFLSKQLIICMSNYFTRCHFPDPSFGI